MIRLSTTLMYIALIAHTNPHIHMRLHARVFFLSQTKAGIFTSPPTPSPTRTHTHQYANTIVLLLWWHNKQDDSRLAYLISPRWQKRRKRMRWLEMNINKEILRPRSFVDKCVVTDCICCFLWQFVVFFREYERWTAHLCQALYINTL